MNLNQVAVTIEQIISHALPTSTEAWKELESKKKQIVDYVKELETENLELKETGIDDLIYRKELEGKIEKLEKDRDGYKHECKRLRDHYDKDELKLLDEIKELETENQKLTTQLLKQVGILKPEFMTQCIHYGRCEYRIGNSNYCNKDCKDFVT